MLKALLGAVLALSSCANARPAAPFNPAAIVQLRCGSHGGFGTAFHIGGGRWVSAEHVTSMGDCSIDGIPAPLVRADRDLDVAELRGPDIPARLEKSCRGFSALGFYRVVGYTAMFGRISVPWQAVNWQDDGGDVFNGEAINGMSGGPAIDNRGRATGVAVRRSPARARDLRDTWLCH